MAHKVKIIADNIKDFKELEEKLKIFVGPIYDQIDTAEKGLAGYVFTISPYSLPKQLYFPGIASIKIEESGLMVHTDHGFFRWTRSGDYKDSLWDSTFVNVKLDDTKKKS